MKRNTGTVVQIMCKVSFKTNTDINIKNKTTTSTYTISETKASTSCTTIDADTSAYIRVYSKFQRA